MFINKIIRILLASLLMGIFFDYVIHFFNDKLLYEASFKAIYLVGVVTSGLIFYLLIAILIKAFKRSDINLKY
jgi:putative peptidoglycan lipid II flippase